MGRPEGISARLGALKDDGMKTGLREGGSDEPEIVAAVAIDVAHESSVFEMSGYARLEPNDERAVLQDRID